MRAPLLTARQVGELLQLGHTATYALLASGQLASYRVGAGPKAQYRVSQEQLDQYLARVESASR